MITSGNDFYSGRWRGWRQEKIGAPAEPGQSLIFAEKRA
jgi:hypothetical protein